MHFYQRAPLINGSYQWASKMVFYLTSKVVWPLRLFVKERYFVGRKWQQNWPDVVFWKIFEKWLVGCSSRSRSRFSSHNWVRWSIRAVALLLNCKLFMGKNFYWQQSQMQLISVIRRLIFDGNILVRLIRGALRFFVPRLLSKAVKWILRRISWFIIELRLDARDGVDVDIHFVVRVAV